MRVISKMLRVFWAAPNTLLGLLIGLVGLCGGGRVQWRGGCVEFHSGVVGWLIRHTPLGESTLALTLGHAILGQTSATLDLARDHEHIHVRQYERWGPFFLGAYFGSSLWLWLTGKRPYRDNPFEVEAYGLAPTRCDRTDTVFSDRPSTVGSTTSNAHSP